MVFASFTGSASLSTKYDIATGDFGMANGSSVNFDIDLLNQTAENENSDKAIYAKINATLKVGLMDANHEDGVSFADPMTVVFVSGDQTATTSGALLGVALSLDTAAIMGDGWSFDITGVTGNPDYAVSAIDSTEVAGEVDDWGFVKETYDDYYTYSAGYAEAPGFSLTYGVSTLGLGYNYVAGTGVGTGTDVTVYVGGDDYQLAEGLMFSGAVAYSQNETATVASGDLLNKTGAASLKLAYSATDYSATVASDYGYDFDVSEGDADVAANVVFDPVTVDAYYATTVNSIDNLLSVQIATDLNAFDMPLTVTLSGKDLIHAQTLEAVFEFTVSDMLTLTATADYTTGTKAWLAQLEAEYVMEDVGTIDASVSLATDSILAMSASIENTTLVENATLSLAWDDANDMLKKDTAVIDFGTITAKCEIDF
jgi:hypothetical protein